MEEDKLYKVGDELIFNSSIVGLVKTKVIFVDISVNEERFKEPEFKLYLMEVLDEGYDANAHKVWFPDDKGIVLNDKKAYVWSNREDVTSSVLYTKEELISRL